ncbi:chorismate-binding protein, partial [Saccharothrix sp. NPDC042600]
MLTIDRGDPRDVVARLTAPDPPPFALLRRACSAGVVEVLSGPVSRPATLDDLALPGDPGDPPAEVLALIPFRQIAERGYACHDDGAPLLALAVTDRAALTVAQALELLPDRGVTVADGRFDVGDGEYERVVRRVVEDDIRTGAGSNFVIRRTFTGTVAPDPPAVALTVFRRLLAAESNAHWTFAVWTGEQAFVGASPEQHVEVAGDVVRMNPISGTHRYPDSGPELSGVLRFLADDKEIDELHMVVDEELKMLAGVCADGVRVRGPRLREMSRLAHTEYDLEGRGAADVRDVLRGTMFAPTVVGSPLENACRVVARHEADGRGYYGGALALVGRDRAGAPALDSAIMIRSAEIGPGGALRIDVGATLVRDSEPAAEA